MYDFGFTDSTPFDDIRKDSRFADLVKVVHTKKSYTKKVFKEIPNLSTPVMAAATAMASMTFLATGGLDLFTPAIATVTALITGAAVIGEYTMGYFWPEGKKLKKGTREKLYKIGDVSTKVTVTVARGLMAINLDMKDQHSDAHVERAYSLPAFMGIAFLKCFFIYMDNPSTGVFRKEADEEVCHCYDLDEIRDHLLERKNVVNKGVILGEYAFV